MFTLVKCNSTKCKSPRYCTHRFKAGKFKNWLLTQLGDEQSVVICPEDKYSPTGFELYFKSAAQIFLDLNNCSEDDIYQMAVVAYFFRDLSPLVALKDKIPGLSDKFYWLYLAQDANVFYSTLEIEMYRRHTTSQINLDNIMDYPFQIGDRLFTLDSSYLPSFMSSFQDNRHNTMMVNANQGKVSENIEHYYDDVTTLCEMITSAGGIIAGGFANSLVNPTYMLVEIPHWYISYNLDEIKKGEPFDENDQDGNLATRFGKTVYRYEANSTDMGKTAVIPGFHDCVRAFYAKTPLDPNLQISQKKKIQLDREKYKHYNLEANLHKLRKHLIVVDGKIFQKFYYYSPDVDIFFTGDDYLNKVNEVIDILSNKLPKKVIYSQFTTTFNIGRNYPKFQLIKRKYNCVEDILAGFDIDSSRVAILSTHQNNWQVLAPQAYIDSITYGHNVIVPCRQSETFNYRLSKYTNRGFTPYIPGDFTIDFKSKIAGKYTYNELLIERMVNKEEKHLSDYDNNPGKNFILSASEKHAKQRKQGALFRNERLQLLPDKIIPEVNDIMYLSNGITQQYIKKLTDGFGNIEQIHVLTFKILVKYISSLFWRVSNPGTQLTGSFNPTTSDYLADIEGKIIKPETTVHILSTYLSRDMVNLVLHYHGEMQEIYSKLMAFSSAIEDDDKLNLVKEIVPDLCTDPIFHLLHVRELSLIESDYN